MIQRERHQGPPVVAHIHMGRDTLRLFREARDQWVRTRQVQTGGRGRRGSSDMFLRQLIVHYSTTRFSLTRAHEPRTEVSLANLRSLLSKTGMGPFSQAVMKEVFSRGYSDQSPGRVRARFQRAARNGWIREDEPGFWCLVRAELESREAP